MAAPAAHWERDRSGSGTERGKESAKIFQHRRLLPPGQSQPHTETGRAMRWADRVLTALRPSWVASIADGRGACFELRPAACGLRASPLTAWPKAKAMAG